METVKRFKVKAFSDGAKPALNVVKMSIEWQPITSKPSKMSIDVG